MIDLMQRGQRAGVAGIGLHTQAGRSGLRERRHAHHGLVHVHDRVGHVGLHTALKAIGPDFIEARRYVGLGVRRIQPRQLCALRAFVEGAIGAAQRSMCIHRVLRGRAQQHLDGHPALAGPLNGGQYRFAGQRG